MSPKQPTKNVQKKNILGMGNSRVTKTARANLIFPVGRIQRQLRDGRYAGRISTSAAVYKAAVLEYLNSEILEMAGQICNANKKQRIMPRHLMKAIKEDAEFAELLKDVNIPYAGVVPFIHPVLLPKASKGKNPTAKKVESNYEGESKDESGEEEESSEEEASAEEESAGEYEDEEQSTNNASELEF